MLLDYVKEYGHTSFHDEALNYLDLLAFTGLSYLDFPSECVGKTLAQALFSAHTPTIVDDDGNRKVNAMENEDDLKLATLVQNAPRYRGVHVAATHSNFLEGFQQFSAIALSIGDLLIAVYRGTDATATGWREALELSLQRPVGAQIDAEDFLVAEARKIDGPIIVCGHSKGGNLAEYAATLLANRHPESAARIAAVVSFDGPGLPLALRQSAGYRAIEGRIRVFMPKSAVIGNIHEHPDGSVTIVDSKEAFLAQHVIYTWRTDGTHFVTKKRQSLAGKAGTGALNALIEHTDDEQKGKIFDTVFALPNVFKLHR